MKTFVAPMLALAVLATAGAQAPAQTKPLPKIELNPPAAKPAAPATPATPKEDAKKKKEEPPAKIEGVTVPRGTGFLGIQIKDGTFKLTFYDAKKKPVPPDASRAVLRWDVRYQPGPERTLLTPGGDAHSLTSEKIIRPPFTFRLTLILLKSADDDANSETFQVDFQQ